MTEAKEPKWLYRLESTDPEKGLWYNANGELVWTIGLIPDCETKSLPMDYDERYRQDGRMWHSSCTNKKDLSHWYTLEAALYLIEKRESLSCSFCGLPVGEVGYLVQSPMGPCICDECVMTAVRMLIGKAVVSKCC